MPRQYTPRVPRVCDQCGIEFAACPSAVKRSAVKYCSRACYNKARGANATKIDVRGYIQEWAPDHPYADRRGYVLQHRLVMERHIRRVLDKREIVHHLDGDIQNNDITNLAVMSQSEHMKLHLHLRHQNAP